MEQIAIIGTGLIGRAWAVVFARAGHTVRLWDHDAGAVTRSLGLITATLEELARARLLDEEPQRVAARIQRSPTLEHAVTGAHYAQESTSELVEVKEDVFRQMDASAMPQCILASSTSTIPASAFTAHLAGRHRCLVAHPVNPPHLIPLVEVSPTPWTDPAVRERTQALLTSAGQVPVLVRREVRGFLVNRLQAALLREAWRLVKEDYCSSEDLDKCVKDGLGLRWAFMGPFETIDLNAPGGIADYASRYGSPMHASLADTRYEPWEPELIARVDAERRVLLPLSRHDERTAWRDRRLMALVAHRRAMGGTDPA